MAMWLKRDPWECGESSSRVQHLVNDFATETREEILSLAQPSLRSHIESCRKCSEALEEALEVRRMLVRLRAPVVDPGEMFTKRVMRAIAALGTERKAPLSAWYALPTLAARFVWVSTVALLLATTWVYQVQTSPRNKGISAEALPASLEPGTPATQDEVLASLVGREP